MAKTRLDSDEKYVLDLTAEAIGESYEWQKHFDTLLGDPGKTGRRRPLPVDAFFPSKNLIVEYKEKQHSQAVSIMDRRMTVSGVTRGEQRKIYDLRKEKWARDNMVDFLAVFYCDLAHKQNGRLLRNREEDLPQMKYLLNKLLKDE